VIDGHTESVQVTLENKVDADDIIEVWKKFRGEPQELDLFYAPKNPIHYFTEPDYPQPRLHRDIEKGMAASVGGLRADKIFDYKFTVLSHNTVRGAAGGSILCAELMNKKGMI
jgi:aspartate-semialdehyde dehydrogenase